MMIPKLIHGYWGGPEMPDYLAGFWRRWAELHPDWGIRLWRHGELPELRLQDIYNNPEKYSPKSNPWQWRSDLVRYELLYDHGGVWVDLDLEPLRPIDDLLGQRFAAWEDNEFIGSSFLGSEPQSAWIARVLEDLPDRIRQHPTLRCNKQVGPWYLTSRTMPRTDVHLLPRELVFGYRWDELDKADAERHPDAYAVHHWHNKRTVTGVPLCV